MNTDKLRCFFIEVYEDAKCSPNKYVDDDLIDIRGRLPEQSEIDKVIKRFGGKGAKVFERSHHLIDITKSEEEIEEMRRDKAIYQMPVLFREIEHRAAFLSKPELVFNIVGVHGWARLVYATSYTSDNLLVVELKPLGDDGRNHLKTAFNLTEYKK